MTLAGFLLVAAFAVPLGLAAMLGKPMFRRRALDLAVLGSVPGLAAAILSPEGSVGLSPSPMRIVLTLDAPGAMLLGGASLLWLLAGLYARTYLAGDPKAARFAFWWLLTLAGSLGTFLVADVASFYLTFSLASLSAYWLVVHQGTPRAGRAAFVYMSLAVLAEAMLLLAFVMLASGGVGNPMIEEAVARLPGSPFEPAVVTLLVVGFGLKMGLVPLHVWMPLAHPVAPMPASAVLSGIIVKAGVIGLIRFLPFEMGLPSAGTVIVAIGLFTAFYAVAVGVTQSHPKTVLAYSTVSQMGFVATILGAGAAAGAATTTTIAAFYALHHLLVKGALFLGVGVVQAGSRHRGMTLAVMAVLALALAGLPLTSGALAKYAAKDLIGEGNAGVLATLAAAGSTVLMLHFLRLLSVERGEEAAKAPAGIVVPWALAASASVLVPWLVAAPYAGIPTHATLAPTALWASTWPLLLGGALALLLARFAKRLPPIPEGDLVVLADGGGRAAERGVEALERADAVLRRWPVGSAALVAVGLVLAVTLGFAG